MTRLDSGYGDMLYDPATKRYLAILYHGTADEAERRNYTKPISPECGHYERLTPRNTLLVLP